MHETNGRKSSNLVKSHELISHLIRLYLVPLPPYEQGNAIVRCFGNWGHEYPLAEDKKYVAAEVAFKFMMDHPKINS